MPTSILIDWAELSSAGCTSLPASPGSAARSTSSTSISASSRAEPAARRQGRRLAGPWRRLLPHGQVPGRAGPHAGRTDLVQMGSLRHLAVRLRAAGDRLLSRRRALPDRQARARPHRADGGGGRVRQPGRSAGSSTRRCAARRSAARGRARAGRLCLPGRADLRLHPRVQRPRRLHADRRADRHHHGGERLRRSSSRTRRRPSPRCSPARSPTRAGASTASSARCTTTTSRCRSSS